MTRNRFFCYIVACTLVFGLTGCGSKYAAATPAPASDTETETSTEEFEPFDGEGAVQGGIKSDEEIAALQEEEQQYAEESTTEYAENVDNTGHEPDSYGSGNFQDYWQGDNYFDLVSYLKDNDAIDAYPSNNHFEKIEGEADVYVAYTNGYTWRLVIYTNDVSGGVILSWMDHMEPPYGQDGPSYMIMANDPSRATIENCKEITIDNYGNTVPDFTLENISAIIDKIKDSTNKTPLSGYEDSINYIDYDL